MFLNPGVYSIGFSVYIPFNGQGNPNDAGFTGSVAGQTLASFNIGSNPAGNWMHYYGVANILSAGTYTTAFTFSTGGYPAKDIVIDRVYLVKGDVGIVPEPATWAMMIVGFASVGGALRSRRRRSLRPNSNA